MIETSALFSQKIAESSRQFRARLLYEGAAVSGEIRNITINKGACGESFSIGSIYSSYIEVTLDKCDEILENKELLLQIGLVIDDTVDYIDMGYYTVTKPSRSTYQTTFTAVGRITSKLNCLPTLPTEQTLAKLAAAITEATGIQIICKGVTLAGTIEEDLTGLTCRELLEVITAVLGGFATEDNAGNIVISKFSTADLVHFNGERTITDPEFSDYDYELTGVKVITTEEWEDEDGAVHSEVSFTEGTPRQILSMKYMTESLFSAFKANVVGYTYRPGTIPLALGDPRLDPWDCILYTDAKGREYVVPCLSIVHTFDGGLSTMITAPGESESESESQVKGPIIQQLERFNSLLITVQEAIIKRLKTDELEAAVAELGYASIEELEAKIAEFGYLKTDELEAEVGKFGYAKVENLNANYARIDQTNITQAWVMDLMVTGNFLADDFNAATGSFSKWLTGVNIVGDMIKGGTIETERLIIRDPEANRGILYEINNGVVDQTNLTEEELKRLCLDGKILVAESVTADKINVTDLFSQNITATGNFNLGEGGALVYDADTDTLTIRAKSILMSSGMSVESAIENAQKSADEAYNEIEKLSTWTHTALSIDEGETLVETNIGGILEVGAINSGSDDNTTSGYVRTSKYIPLISGESYTWNVLLDEVSTIPTTWFYQRGSSEDNEVFECLNSTTPVNTATITVPPSENQVYVRASIHTALNVDLISGTLTLDNLTSHLQSSDSMLYSGVSVTLNQYPPIEGKAYVWNLTDDKIQQYVTNLLSATEEKFDVNLKDLSDKIYGADGSVEELQRSLKALQDSLGNYDGYIQIIPDEATIKLGKVDTEGSTAPKVVINNEKISFQKNDVEGASIGYTDSTGERTSMMADSAYITEYFPRVKVGDEWVGAHCWVTRSNGHLSLKVVK